MDICSSASVTVDFSREFVSMELVKDESKDYDLIASNRGLGSKF